MNSFFIKISEVKSLAASFWPGILMDVLNILFILILILLTAFFVATEFAVVKVRPSRIDQLVQEKRKGALAAKKLISNLDEYLSACQFGITVTALALGWIGEPTVHHLLLPLFEKLNFSSGVASTVSFIISFSLITYLHVVVGELAPKTFAIVKAEQVALLFSKPLILFYKLMYPFIWVLNGSARGFVGLFGIKLASEHEEAHSQEELRIIVGESYKSGEIKQSNFNYVNNIFEFDNRIAKEIMVPRVDIVTLSKNNSIQECLKIFKSENFTRYPVIDGNRDRIIGIIHVKDVLTDFAIQDKIGSIEEYIRPIIRVTDSILIQDLLLKMQKDRIQLAILMDEYGGTSGIVTIEDIIEEIVGEIRDEFDADETNEIEKTDDGTYLVDAKVLIGDINDLLGIEILEEDVDTIGGWVMAKNYDTRIGDCIRFGDFQFKIIEMENHQVRFIEIIDKKLLQK
jgi:CBS domain containing-hemolysin-like protein